MLCACIVSIDDSLNPASISSIPNPPDSIPTCIFMYESMKNENWVAHKHFRDNYTLFYPVFIFL